MRRLLFLLLLAWWGPLAALAGQRVTVQQLDQLLATLHNQSDGKVAGQLFGLELTERASSLRLARYQAAFPGPHAREALLALGDASAFLDLPVADIPNLAKPDDDEIQQTLLLAQEFVVTTLATLPNFIAKRSTTRFESMGESSATAQTWALHVVGHDSSTISYRNGVEVLDGKAARGRRAIANDLGFTTFGEFGPILGNVIGDTIRGGQLDWAHWEEGATGPMEVFHYSVPAEASHFTLSFGGGWQYAIRPGKKTKNAPEVQFPAYHGEIAVDPESGSILRLSMVSELRPPKQSCQTAILVEYGPVAIGNLSYICLLRGVAFHKLAGECMPESASSFGSSSFSPAHSFVNDARFTEYHVFRSEARILPD